MNNSSKYYQKEALSLYVLRTLNRYSLIYFFLALITVFVITAWLVQPFSPEDYENLLKHCFESLEEEGKFIVVQPSRLESHNPFSYEVLLLVKQDFRGFPSQESLTQLLEKAGFENIAILENFVILAEKPSK